MHSCHATSLYRDDSAVNRWQLKQGVSPATPIGEDTGWPGREASQVNRHTLNLRRAFLF
jgi:hypothetical protein